MARLGASGSRKGENAKILQKPNESRRFLTLGALLGGPLAASGAPSSLLAASREPIRPSRGPLGPPRASWAGRLGFWVCVPLFGPLLGQSWGPLGPSWGPPEPSWSVGKPKRREGQHNVAMENNECGFSGLSSPVYVCCVSVLYMLYFCTHVRLCACMYIRMHECMHVCMRTHVCELVCMRVSTGLRPLPPPCLGGSEASCVFVGISW